MIYTKSEQDHAIYIIKVNKIIKHKIYIIKVSKIIKHMQYIQK